MMTDWLHIWKAHIRTTPNQREVAVLLGLKLEPHQAAWLLVEYKQAAAYPNVQDFVEWLAGSDPPSELVSAAFLTEQPTVVTMGEQLNTLEAAWYPTEQTTEEIGDLKKRLRAAL